MGLKFLDIKKIIQSSKRSLWCLYAPKIEDRGAYCFCPVCHSVILSSSLNLTFEPWVLELCDFTWEFLVIRPFRMYHYILPLTLEFDLFFENFYIANNFWTVSGRALMFHMSIPCDETFPLLPLFLTLWPAWIKSTSDLYSQFKWSTKLF